MTRAILTGLELEVPPEDLTEPLKALWWLKKGNLRVGPEWRQAHEICQDSEGVREYDLVHGLAHLIEGDVWNADYWYRRASEKRSGDNVGEEWERLVFKLSAKLD